MNQWISESVNTGWVGRMIGSEMLLPFWGMFLASLQDTNWFDRRFPGVSLTLNRPAYYMASPPGMLLGANSTLGVVMLGLERLKGLITNTWILC